MPRTRRWATIALTLAIVELALTTAYIHFSLGGPLFTLNAVGYAVLGIAYAAAAMPVTIARRLGWAPRIALAGYTMTTIGAYAVMGPYFTLGWVAKAVEVAILTLIAADLARAYGSPADLLAAVLGRARADRPRVTCPA